MPVQFPDNQKGDQGGVRIILAMTNFKYSLDFFPTKHDEPVGVDDNTLWCSMSTADALSALFIDEDHNDDDAETTDSTCSLD